jgi:hypothetical protein
MELKWSASSLRQMQTAIYLRSRMLLVKRVDTGGDA